MVEKLKDAKTTPVVNKEKIVPTKNTMIIKKCKNNCKHPYQDQLYGIGMRAMNSTGNRSGAGSYRCTVCSTIN